MAAPTDASAPTLIEPRWGIGDVVGGWLLAYVAAAIFGLILLSAMGYQAGDDLSLSVIALTQLPLWMGFAGVPIWVAAIKGNGWIADFRVKLTTLDVPLGIVVGVAAQLVMVPLVSWPWIRLLGVDQETLERPAREMADKANGAGGVLLFLLIVGLFAPVAEELFFRGLGFRAFEKRFGTWWGLTISSVFFAATHMQVVQLPALAVVGAIFGYLVVRTGRLGPAIIAHMAFNTTTVIALLWL